MTFRRIPISVALFWLVAASMLSPSPVPASQPVQVDAVSAFLVEVSTGTVLLEQAPDVPIEPASFTKLMTLYLVFEAVEQGTAKWDDAVWISEKAWRTGGSKMFIEVGTRVPLEDLVKGIAVVSGNDACVAVAEHLFGTVESFVDAMNRKAEELGMTATRFRNPHGLPHPEQITTARDMATLAIAYLRRFPEALRFHSMLEYSYNNITQPNRNHLLTKDPTVDGLKTGYVAAAGYHLAATSLRDGMRLLAVVMGAKSPSIREAEAQKLLNYGFRSYVLLQPFEPGKPVAAVRVWKGVKDSLELFPASAEGFVVPAAMKDAVRTELKVPESVTAPIGTGAVIGSAVIAVGDGEPRVIDLVSREDIPQAGVFLRAWHSLLKAEDWNWGRIGAVTGGIAVGAAALVFLALLALRRRNRKRRSAARFHSRRF
jgi:D-alanyl-D-alanine carboxypeptidase (penicillin-binding protein 5/6)